MSTERQATDFYVTGGTMSPDAESYVERPADEELFRAVERGEYCYVLTTRQMGKSSLMARTAQRLAADGVRSAQITLETIRESGAAPSPDQFLYGIASRIHRALGLGTPLADWWRERDLLSATQRFHEFLTEFLLESCDVPIVVFIDEIDSTIGLPFADDFFATIRACYNGRASKPALKRLTFVLLGVATPAQLIADPTRTPFNIGTGIELTDFTPREAEPLTRGFPGSEAQKRALLDRVLYWTGGHPYLTQTLCRGLAASASRGIDPAAGPDATVDAEVERLFLRPEAAREEANLKFVRSRLTQGTRDLRAVLRTYRQVLAGERVEDKPASSIHASLKLAGVVRTDADGLLRPRNRIYERVFGLEWVKRELPRDRWRTVAAAAAVLLIVGRRRELSEPPACGQKTRSADLPKWAPGAADDVRLHRPGVVGARPEQPVGPGCSDRRVSREGRSQGLCRDAVALGGCRPPCAARHHRARLSPVSCRRDRCSGP